MLFFLVGNAINIVFCYGCSEGSKAFQLCVRSLREFLAQLKKNHTLWSALPAQARGLVAAFDEEMFCAHARDYCERCSIYGKFIRTSLRLSWTVVKNRADLSTLCSFFRTQRDC